VGIRCFPLPFIPGLLYARVWPTGKHRALTLSAPVATSQQILQQKKGLERRREGTGGPAIPPCSPTYGLLVARQSLTHYWCSVNILCVNDWLTIDCNLNPALMVAFSVALPALIATVINKRKNSYWVPRFYPSFPNTQRPVSWRIHFYSPQRCPWTSSLCVCGLTDPLLPTITAVSPEIHMLKTWSLNKFVDGICWWGFWEVVWVAWGHVGGVPMRVLVASSEKEKLRWHSCHLAMWCSLPC
jgi:hypothetical protein